MLCTLRTRRHDLSLCLRADRWLRDNVYRLLIKGLTRLHNEKRIKDTFTDNNIKRQKNYLMERLDVCITNPVTY